MKEKLNWVIKGLAIGAADVVPGVSGGTIAFILGLYERLLKALASFDLHVTGLVRRRQFKAAWEHIDGTFLLCLFSGIVLSIFTLATTVSYLIENRPVPLWAFFTGIIAAALPYLLRTVQFNPRRIALLTGGILFALTVSMATPTQTEPVAFMFFIAGFLAICAMIMPGISGSFVLLLIGMYAPVLAAVSSLDIGILVLFASGCLLGLLTFSKVLNYLLKRFHDNLLAFLYGAVIGALYRIWPWQIEGNILSPWQYADATGSFDLLAAGLGFIGGVVLIHGLFWIERYLGTPRQPQP